MSSSEVELEPQDEVAQALIQGMALVEVQEGGQCLVKVVVGIQVWRDLLV